MERPVLKYRVGKGEEDENEGGQRISDERPLQPFPAGLYLREKKWYNSNNLIGQNI